jgi:hypothetical protein
MKETKRRNKLTKTKQRNKFQCGISWSHDHRIHNDIRYYIPSQLRWRGDKNGIKYKPYYMTSAFYERNVHFCNNLLVKSTF